MGVWNGTGAAPCQQPKGGRGPGVCKRQQMSPWVHLHCMGRPCPSLPCAHPCGAAARRPQPSPGKDQMWGQVGRTARRACALGDQVASAHSPLLQWWLEQGTKRPTVSGGGGGSEGSGRPHPGMKAARWLYNMVSMPSTAGICQLSPQNLSSQGLAMARPRSWVHPGVGWGPAARLDSADSC